MERNGRVTSEGRKRTKESMERDGRGIGKGWERDGREMDGRGTEVGRERDG
jgi:hypothetical protein